MTSKELYSLAYHAQFHDKNSATALNYYQQLVDLFPNSVEAGYAKEQIEILSETINLSPDAETSVTSSQPSASDRASDDVYRDSFTPQRVVLVDFDIPFWSLVSFLVKFAIASIPATIIVSIIFAILWAVFGGMLFALSSGF